MIEALIGFAIGVAFTVVADQLLWSPTTHLNECVKEHVVGTGIELRCSHCCKACHIAPGTRVSDAVFQRMLFLRQHNLCVGVNDS